MVKTKSPVNKIAYRAFFIFLVLDLGPRPSGCGGDCWYYFDVNVTETTGLADVVLTHRYIEWLSGGTDTRYDPVAKFGTDTVPAGGTLTDPDRWLCTCEHPESLTETWYGSSSDQECSGVSDSYTIDIA